jgi:hypothetical protein
VRCEYGGSPLIPGAVVERTRVAFESLAERPLNREVGWKSADFKVVGSIQILDMHDTMCTRHAQDWIRLGSLPDATDAELAERQGAAKHLKANVQDLAEGFSQLTELADRYVAGGVAAPSRWRRLWWWLRRPPLRVRGWFVKRRSPERSGDEPL